jgi:hypothetical protein
MKLPKEMKVMNPVEKVKYFVFGKQHIPNEYERAKRAWDYMFAITAINDVGAGADDCFGDIKTVIGMLKEICLKETGILIDDYATNEVGCHYKGWKKNPFERGKKDER